MTRSIPRSLFAVLWIVACRSAALSAPPAGTYLLRQTFTPGTYYRVTNIDTRQKDFILKTPDSERNAPEENTQKIIVVKMVVHEPDEEGAKTVTITFERIQWTTNMNDTKMTDYDSMAPENSLDKELKRCFDPLLKAKGAVILDRENNVVSARGLEGIWDKDKIEPNANSRLDEIKRSFNNETLKEIILFYRGFLPAKPVTVGATWTKQETTSTSGGDMNVSMNITFASIEKEKGRRQALIVISGRGHRMYENKSRVGDSSAGSTAVDVQRKGMVRFDLAAGRVSEANLLQSTIFTVTSCKKTEKEDDASPPRKITIRDASSMKQYVNEVPPELTAPPSVAPTSPPAKRNK